MFHFFSWCRSFADIIPVSDMPRRRLLLLGLCILTSYGCQSTPPREEPAPGPVAVVQPAALDASRLLEDARRASDPRRAAALFLEAARVYYATGDLAAAQATLARASVDLLSPDAVFEHHYLTAQLAYRAGRVNEAAEALLLAIPSSAQQQERYLALRAQLSARRGDHVRAAVALMDLGDLLASRRELTPEDVDRLQQLHDEIWQQINLVPAYRIPRLAAETAGPVPKGWWSLAAALLQGFDLTAQRNELATWRRQNQRHPAARVPPQALTRIADLAATPHHVALLLPLSGPLANAGRAVREGFMAGFYFAGGDMSVSVYDTNGASVAALYEEALLNGADLVVGPLDRASLMQLNALPYLHVPVLGLNYLADEALANGRLFQFSMAIEHEAHAIARQLIEDGHRRVVLFHAGDDWSHRARREFRARFADYGGVILEEDFFAAATDVTPAVARVLLVQNSAERHGELARLLGHTPEFMPRRRHDVDAVVALVDASQARALQPALAFHFASEIPVYSTSQALQALARTAWRELDGMRISQIPWRVYPSPIKNQLNNYFQSSRGDLESLYAFGLDAYRIADRIHSLADDADARMVGGTGILRVDGTGRITRDLVWTIMRNGNLQAMPVGGS
jgi:uncharacterized protein